MKPVAALMNFVVCHQNISQGEISDFYFDTAPFSWLRFDFFVGSSQFAALGGSVGCCPSNSFPFGFLALRYDTEAGIGDAWSVELSAWW